MNRSFLEVFPREIRDQIYAFVLGSPSLTPWTRDVEQSLLLLRVCKQIKRECKAMIWHDHALSLRPITQLSQRLLSISASHSKCIEHIRISLEVLDGDELEWISTALPALVGTDSWTKLRSITVMTNWERPRNIWEFQQEMELRRGIGNDGRLYHCSMDSNDMRISTGWPRFCHWGKQNWLRGLLIDVERVDEMLLASHMKVGGEMWVDGMLCFKDGKQIMDKFRLDPRKGEVKMIFGY